MAVDLERLFDTFLDRRDPSALSAVFDATASELLLVAAHLVGNRADAEDVLQATFVAAIEGADGFERGRPLKPWLLGILVNRAKMVGRRRRRSRTAEYSDTPDARRDADPIDAVAGREVAQQISEAIEGLPKLYRHILVLHLVHGLGGTQIAQSLDRSPATVRTQIKRGLEMLRGALPAALAVPVSLLATEGRGLAAVREAVIGVAAGQAAIVAGGATAAVTGGVVVMKKVAAFVVAAVLGLGVWIGTRPDDSEPVVASSGSEDVPDREVVESSTPSEERAEVGSVEPSGSQHATKPGVVLRGRLVAAWDGTPQPAERIVIRGWPRPIGTTAPPTAGDPRLAEGPAGADGRFEFELPFDPALRYEIGVTGDRFVPMWGSITVERPGVRDLGDIAVRSGARLRIRVVDENDQPMPDLTFTIEYPSPALQFETTAMTRRRTDALGVLQMHDDARVMPGEVVLSEPVGYEIVRMRRFQIEPNQDVADPTVVVRARDADDSIRGVVHDERGEPIAGARFRIEGRPRDGVVEYERSDRDGRFQAFRRNGDPPVEVQLTFYGTDRFAPVRTGAVRWGDEVAVVQPDARTIELRVVDAHTGEPLQNYESVHVSSADPTRERHHVAGPHIEGRTLLEGLPQTGNVAVIIAPGTEDYEFSEQLVIDLARAGNAPVEIALRRREPARVRVVGRDGEPVAGSKVELVQIHDGADLAADELVLPRSTLLFNLGPGRRTTWPTAFSIDEATSDADGLVEVRCARTTHPIAVVVTGDGHATTRVSGVEFAGDEPVEIVVEAGASIAGVLKPDGVCARFARVPGEWSEGRLQIAVRRPGGEIVPRPGGRNRGYSVRRDQSFEIHGLASGRWELLLYWMRPLTATSARSHTFEEPLAIVDLDASRVEPVEIDIEPIAAATIDGVVMFRGVPLSGAVITFARMDDRNQVIDEDLGGCRTDASGRFAIGGLLRGRYTLFAEWTDASGRDCRAQSESVVIRAGARLERAFHLD